MSAFDHVRDMYDVALQPRLLRNLIKQHLPDEKRPLGNPSQLSHVVSSLKTHRLLSESFPEDTNRKIVENWKKAVDSWVERLCSLASSNMPDKCWAGVSLLGVTCQECSSERFLASYSVWFQKLLSHIQPPADSHFVKVASCTSLSDLLSRLGGFPNVKKDGVSCAGKLVQPLLKLLNEDSSEAVWEGAVRLLCTAVTFFPSSVQRHYDSAEAAVVLKITLDKCSDNMLKSLAHSLALLPKSKGDEDSWLLMMQKILLSIHLQLNDVFQGLEEEAKSNEALRLLVPPGKEHPPPLGCQATSGEAVDHSSRRSERFVMSRVSTLMLCCSAMLTNSYPVQVSVPVRPLLALVGRVLIVNGSFPQGQFPYMTAMQQEFLCSQLPVLHTYSLDLLTAIMKGLRSQLLPYAAEIVRLLAEYFRGCVLPELRVKVYSIIKMLLLSLGVGIAAYIAEEVISNAFADLYSISHESGGVSSDLHSKNSVEASSRPSHRKRKHNAAAGLVEQQHHGVGFDVKATNKFASTPTSVMIAALEALETLLVVGGASKSQAWRSNVDHLLITVATNACNGGWASEEANIFLPNGHASTWADLQLASLRALLSSLLSPAHVRPPYLPQGLELFRRGKLESGTRLAQFCAHALLALEVLIHPRAYSLVDFTTANSDLSNGVSYKFSHYEKHKIPFSSGTLGTMGIGDQDHDEDELYRSWLENGDQVEVSVTDYNKVGEPFKSNIDPRLEKLHSVCGLVSVDAEVMVLENSDEPMAETQQSQEPVSRKVSMISTVNAVAEMELCEGISNNSLDHTGNDISFDQDNSKKLLDGFNAIGKDSFTTKLDRGKDKVFERDDESSLDSFPEINVDADPDSD